jgi:hypothetical protein
VFLIQKIAAAGSHLSVSAFRAEAHLSEPPLHLVPRVVPRSAGHGTARHARARAIKAAPRSGRAGLDAAVALSDAASRLASCACPDSPGLCLGRLAIVPPGRSEAAAHHHGPDVTVALAAARVSHCAAVSSHRAGHHSPLSSSSTGHRGTVSHR